MGEMKTTVLVTGGCGFIGTWVLKELLRRGAAAVALDVGGRPERWERVLGVDAQRVPLVTGSLLDRQMVARLFQDHNITHVIHLAALLTPACHADPWLGCQVNVMGSLALFEEARARGNQVKGFAYASSVAAFGEAVNSNASGTTVIPPTFYGVFKQTVEHLAHQYWRHFGIPSLGIRPQVAYGPEREVGLTAGPSVAARAVALGQNYEIGYTGSVGYDYVEDVALAFVLGALQPPRGALTADLTGEFADITDVLRLLEAAAPGSPGVRTARGPVVPAITPENPSPVAKLYPGWQTTSLADGLRRTVAYYQQRGA